MCDSAHVAVVVARFEPVVALGLNIVLSEEHQFRVLESGLGDAALLRAIVRWAPQIAILDERAERVVRRRLRSSKSLTGIVVFAHEPTPAYGMMLLAVGATCVARNVPTAEILAALRLVADGGRTFVSGNGDRVERCCPTDLPALTQRQFEVLERLSEGKPHKRIAHELGIGVRTVHTYTSQICHKWGVRSKRELIGVPTSAPASSLG